MSVQLLTNPDRRVAVLLLPDPKRRSLRFLFRYGDDFRAMSWMQVGSDGSLYLNPRRKPAGPGIHAEGVNDGKGGISDITWVEIERTDVVAPKVSHHASGLVKTGSHRSMSVNVRDIQVSTLIRMQDYSHPSRFDVIPQQDLRQTDVVVPWFTGQPYELFDDKALTSRIWVAPLDSGHAQVPVIEDIDDALNGQTAVVVPVQGLDNCQDLTFQVQFFSRSGDWPEMDWITTPKLDDVRGRGEVPVDPT